MPPSPSSVAKSSPPTHRATLGTSGFRSLTGPPCGRPSARLEQPCPPRSPIPGKTVARRRIAEAAGPISPIRLDRSLAEAYPRASCVAPDPGGTAQVLPRTVWDDDDGTNHVARRRHVHALPALGAACCRTPVGTALHRGDDRPRGALLPVPRHPRPGRGLHRRAGVVVWRVRRPTGTGPTGATAVDPGHRRHLDPHPRRRDGPQ